MFQLWRYYTLEPKTGLPWPVVLSMPWLLWQSTQQEASQNPTNNDADQVASDKATTVTTKATTTKAATTKAATTKAATTKAATTKAATTKAATTKAATTKAATTKAATTKAATTKAATTKAATTKAATTKAATTKAATTKAATTKAQTSGNATLSAQEKNLITQISPLSPKEQIRKAIELLCSTKEWTNATQLADRLQHTPSQLETLHLQPMVNAGILKTRHAQIDHPDQAYALADSKK